MVDRSITVRNAKPSAKKNAGASPSPGARQPRKGAQTPGREPVTPRPRDPEVTRGRILQAAEDIFLRKGFGNTVISEIAEQAGVTKSLIHHHFGSKEDLWSTVKLRRFSQYAEQQMAMLEDAPASADLLRGSFAYYFHFLQSNPQLVRIMAWLFLEPQAEDFSTMDRDLMLAGVEKIREAQQAEHLRSDVDPRHVLVVFVGLAQHWFQDRDHFLRAFGKGRPPPNDKRSIDAAFFRDAMTILLEGVLPR
ncbi:MAG: TetR/AcrR family transcriptional regulator [Pseudomonadota bacterium]